MALGVLAQFITRLTAQPFSAGLANRKNFNEHPDQAIPGNLTGPDLSALLDFRKGVISAQVLNRLKENDPNLGNPDDARDFALWFYDFTQWQFDAALEEKEYTGVFPQPIKAMYPNPECQLRKVNVTTQTPVSGGKQIDLDIYGEGFVRGKTTVNIFRAGDSKPLKAVLQDPTNASTFRGALIQLQGVVLAPGNYKVSVDVNCGDGVIFTINNPAAAAAFTVT